MKIAQDLMTKKPITIQSGSDLEDAAKVFTENNIHSAPVVTPSNEILGVLTDFNLVKAKIQHKIGNQESSKVFHYKSFLVDMSMVKETTPIGEVIQHLLKTANNRIYILNNNDQITGVISPQDILRFLNGENSKSNHLKVELDETKEKLENLEDHVELLAEDLAKYKDIFYDTPTMIHSCNEEGVIIMANKKIHQVLGYEEGDLIGKKIFEIYPKSVHHEAVAGLQKIMNNGYHQHTYTTMVKQTGEKIRVDIASSALYTKHHKFIGTISVSRELDSEALLRALHGVVDSE